MKFILYTLSVFLIYLGIGILFASMGGYHWGTPEFVNQVGKTFACCIPISIVIGFITLIYYSSDR